MNKFNFDNWKARPHFAGLLMTEPKGKTFAEKLAEARLSLNAKTEKYVTLGEKALKSKAKLDEEIRILEDITIPMLERSLHIPRLSETCRTRLNQEWTVQTSGRTKDIKNKYINKGLDLEEDALTQYSLFTSSLWNKNQFEAHNSYVTTRGCDSYNEDVVIDTKVSWDIFSFDNNRFKKINPLYDWQLQIYCWLWNKKEGRLVYVLLNTPEYLIKAEEKRLSYELFGISEPESEEQKDLFSDARKELRHNHIYDDLDLSRKIQVYTVKRDDEKIDRLKTRIEECRYYLNNISNQELNEQEEI
jgi:hypothetical protein